MPRWNGGIIGVPNYPTNIVGGATAAGGVWDLVQQFIATKADNWPQVYQDFIALAHAFAPYLSVWGWSSARGFETKFANPGTLPPGAIKTAFSPSGNAIACNSLGSPYINAYPWSGSGFGTKFSNPGTLPAGSSSVQGLAFSPAGNAIVAGMSPTVLAPPYVIAYAWSGSGFGTKFSDPAVPPTSTVNDIAFTPAADVIALAHVNAPRITAYAWSGSGFGTKFSDPSTAIGMGGISVTFSPSADAIVMGSNTTPYVVAYAWSGSGFGTRFSAPGANPGTRGNSVAFSPDGKALAVAHIGTPYITVYPWSASGYGTKFSDPGTLPGTQGNGVAFNLTGDALAVAHSTFPYITVYAWSGSGFGTKYADPKTLIPPGGAQWGTLGNWVAFTRKQR